MDKKIDLQNHHTMFEMLDEFDNRMHLTQLVNFNTWRRIINGELRTSLLDHVYENEIGLVENISEISTSTSDHTPLLLSLSMTIRRNTETTIVRNWSNYNKEKLIQLLKGINWEIDCLEVQYFNNELEQKLMSVLETLIPFEEKKVRS